MGVAVCQWKVYLQKQVAGWMWPMGRSLLTPVLCSVGCLLNPTVDWEWSCNQGNISTLGTVGLILSDERIWHDRWWGKLELPGNLIPSVICLVSLMRPSDTDHWQHLPVLPLLPEHTPFGNCHGPPQGLSPPRANVLWVVTGPFSSPLIKVSWVLFVLSREIWEFHGWTEKSPVP